MYLWRVGKGWGDGGSGAGEGDKRSGELVGTWDEGEDEGETRVGIGWNVDGGKVDEPK